MITDENYNLPLLPIRKAAKILEISVHTLRMYEKEGLIIPFKKESSHRLYSSSDIERLKCIRKAINESKISIAGIKTIYSMIPCFQILKCSKTDRENCKAYNEHAIPCWSYNHISNPCKGRECRSCRVYLDYSDCGSIKDFIKESFSK